MADTAADFLHQLAAVGPADRAGILLRAAEAHPDGPLSLPAAVLNDVDLSRDALGPRADFPSAVLAGAAFRRAKLAGTGFERADLSGADLAGADLRRANLAGTNLTDALLEDADLSAASLRFATLKGGVLDGAKLPKADLWGVKAEGAVFAGADLRGAMFEEADLRGADLRGADLRGAVLREARLAGADLTGADLQGAVFGSTDLTGAVLRDAKLQALSLTGCTLTGVHLADAWFDRTRFLREQLGGRLGEEEVGEYELARRGYLALERNFDQTGDPDAASWAYRRKRRMKKWHSYQTATRAWRDGNRFKAAAAGLGFAQDQLVEWVCDYGESVWRVLGTLLTLFLVFLGFYLMLGSVVRTDLPNHPRAERFSEVVLYAMSATTSPGNPPQGLGAKDEISYLLTGAHSLLAIFLIGLLGFVAGNRIRR